MKELKKQPLFGNHGIGVGLRVEHFADFLNSEGPPRGIQWAEAISENFMAGPRLQNTGAKQNLLRIRESLPIALHGVSMSLGSATGLDPLYLKNLKALVDEVEPIVVSDHLCWTRVGRSQSHDLNPLPYTRKLARFVADQVLRAQDVLQRRMLIENVSTYLTHTSSEMSEEEFILEIVELADCGLLLDLNNVYVSATNHGFDPHAFLKRIPAERVGQLHLAGHSVQDGFLIDTHDEPVCEAVWELYSWYGKTHGHPSAMLERDGNIPEWSEMGQELGRMTRDFIPNQEITRHVRETRAPAPPSQKIGRPETLESFLQLQKNWFASLVGDYRLDQIRSDAKLGARERFEIYETAYWLRLNEALEQDFPELKARLGEDAFDELVFEVLKKHPSQSYSLNELGFEFMKGLREQSHTELPLAEREWAACLAYLNRAQPDPTGTETRFEQLMQENPADFDRICMVLHPSAQLLDDQRAAIWHDSEPKQKSFGVNEWPAIVALASKTPLSKWEGIPGLTPENLQAWTKEGLIRGYQKNQEA